MPINVYGSYQTVVGMAKESVIGTAINPTRFLPSNPPKPKDDIKFYVDKAYRGLPVEEYGEYPLAGISTFGIDGPFYPDDPGALLYAVLGQNNTTVAPSSTTLAASGTLAAGATSLTLTSGTGFANGMAIIIDSGVLSGGVLIQESNLIISGGGTATVTLLAPTRFAHTKGTATVAGNNMHNMQALPSGFLNGTQYNPPTYTIFDNYGEAQRYYPNSYCDTFSLKYTSEADCTYTASFTGALSQTPTQAGLTVPSAFTYTAVPPFVGWQGGFAYVPVGGAITSVSKLVDCSVDLKRKITPVYGQYNTQSPTVFLPSIQSIAGKITLQMQDENEYNVFRASSHPQMLLGLMGPAGFTGGSPAPTGFMLQIDNPTWKAAVIDRAKDYVQVAVDWAATFNATDFGNALVFLTNSKSAANMIN